MIVVKYKECMIDMNGCFLGFGLLFYLEENYFFFVLFNIYMILCDVY